MRGSGWYPALILAIGVALALGVGDAVWILPFAGGALGVFLWELAPPGRRRQREPLDGAIDALERFVRRDEPHARWYVDPGLDLEAASVRLNAALDALGEERAGLERDRRRLRSLLRALESGSVVIDGDDRVALASQGAAALLGTTPPELRDRPLLGFDGMLAVDEAVRGARADGSPRTVGVVMPDGRRIEARVHSIPESSETWVLLRDTSLVHRLETESSEILQNLSHEIRTPITSVRGFAETLLDPGLTEAERERFLRTILRETARVAALIEEVTELGSPELRRPAGDLSETDVVALLTETAEAWSPILERAGLDFDTRLPAALRLVTDKARLHEIVTILLDNAQKYTEPGGHVTLGVTVEAGRTVVYVSDTGRGIREEDSRRIFERFYRVDRDRSRDSGGSGLGLAIAQKLATSLGAALTVESTLGRGSIFSLTFIGEDEPA